MKILISYLISAIVIVAVFFTVLYRIIKLEFSDALIAAISGVVAGIVVELFNKGRKRKLKDIEA
ncbi:MAG: hypothetical protein ACTHMD_00380 [Flavisolibacter sp.]